MDVFAFLDDYDLIRLYNIQPNFLDGLKVFANHLEVNYEINLYNDYVELHLAKRILLENGIFLFKDGKKISVVYRLVTHTEQFDKEFVPDIKTLGSIHFERNTLFRFWAPFKDGVDLVINGRSIPMAKMSKGIWQVVVRGDNDGARYHYVMKKDGILTSIIDPFSYAKNYEGNESYVVDSERIISDKVTLLKCEDPIIYEMNVRDFSSNFNGFINKRRLTALIQEGAVINSKPVGFDYLKTLGITHVQIMPILDFDNDGSDYNWGYNPVGYNTFKQSYIDAIDPYGQIKEVKNVVNKFHENNIGVILDVVFNHVYQRDTFILNKILPYYFYRFEGHSFANGAGLGNEVRTESKFMSDYIVLMCKRLQSIYDIDGLRFDLSGLMDINTCNNIRKEIIKDKEDFITIGEGWNMGTSLKDDMKACYTNAKNIEGYLFFNPRFKRTIIGEDEHMGIIFGDQSYREETKRVVAAYDEYLDAKQSLNYTECHDGYTAFDYIRALTNDNDEMVNKKARLALALTMLSRGVPFIQMGQEFYRTKMGEKNSYNKGDVVNSINWFKMIENEEAVNYFKELVKLRRNIKEYLDSDNVGFEDYYELIIINIKDLKILINPCPFDHIYNKDIIYETIFDGMKNVEVMDSAINVKAFMVVVAKTIG